MVTSVNKDVRELLRGLLVNASIGCEVYNKMLPPTANDDIFTLITTQQNTQANTLITKDVRHFITFQVVQKSTYNANEVMLDSVAEKIIETLMNHNFTALPNGEQIYNFALENDITLQGLTDGDKLVTQRNIIFSLLIKYN